MMPEDQLSSEKKTIIIEMFWPIWPMKDMPEKIKKMVDVYNKLSEEEQKMFCMAIDKDKEEEYTKVEGMEWM